MSRSIHLWIWTNYLCLPEGANLSGDTSEKVSWHWVSSMAANVLNHVSKYRPFSPKHKDSHNKIRWAWERIIFMVRIPKLVGQHLYIESEPGFLYRHYPHHRSVAQWQDMILFSIFPRNSQHIEGYSWFIWICPGLTGVAFNLSV